MGANEKSLDSGVGQTAHLVARYMFADGGWLTSHGILRLTGDDLQFRAPSKNTALDRNSLLNEGVGGDWAGKSGGSS